MGCLLNISFSWAEKLLILLLHNGVKNRRSLRRRMRRLKCAKSLISKSFLMIYWIYFYYCLWYSSLDINIRSNKESNQRPTNSIISSSTVPIFISFAYFDAIKVNFHIAFLWFSFWESVWSQICFILLSL